MYCPDFAIFGHKDAAKETVAAAAPVSAVEAKEEQDAR
jgi:hypothetical protein